jgi:hypothetical protein
MAVPFFALQFRERGATVHSRGTRRMIFDLQRPVSDSLTHRIK